MQEDNADGNPIELCFLLLYFKTDLLSSGLRTPEELDITEQCD